MAKDKKTPKQTTDLFLKMTKAMVSPQSHLSSETNKEVIFSFVSDNKGKLPTAKNYKGIVVKSTTKGGHFAISYPPKTRH